MNRQNRWTSALFKRRSVTYKLLVGTFACILLMLLFNFLLNNFALESYYRYVKKNTLVNSFSQLSQLEIEGGDTLENQLIRLRNNDNIGTLIWRPDGILYDYRADGKRDDSKLLREAVKSCQSGEYYVQLWEDAQVDSYFLTLCGKTAAGSYVLMRTSLQAMEDNVSIANTFLLFSCLPTLLIGVLLMFWVSRNFTRPIRQLSKLAGQVAQLDFSGRYYGDTTDEIDQLGNSINTMSDALETTISGLQEANRLLEQENREKTSQDIARKAFVSNVSHELKTPIALIQTYAEGMREGVAVLPEDQAYYCSVIEDEAHKMSVLIRKMTSLMQLESGTEPLSPEAFDVGELIRNLIRKNQPRLTEKNIRVQLEPDNAVCVWADSFLIEEVLNNFFSNALNHVTEPGVIRFTLSPLTEDRVRLSVFNTGAPIPPEELPHIWEGFYKVDKARTRAYGGTGIGLTVVAAIMHAHGMPYGVRNETDGVSFFVELPLYRENFKDFTEESG